MIEPIGTDALGALLTVPSVRPALTRAAAAAACVTLTTFGTILVAELLTITEMVSELVLPAASDAMAAIERKPLVTVVESQVRPYGGVSCGGPWFVPSIWNCTAL